MRLENVLALTHGQLVNDPFVKNFTNTVFDVKAVKRGDLFMAFHEEDIEEAILNGAYGILFSKPTQISDSEIAWIKVQDLEEALKRLLRFRLIEKSVTVYETNEIVLKLALQVVTESRFIAINGSIKNIAKDLWDIEESATILFAPSLVDKNIFTHTIELSQTPLHKINIIEQTLFETSFIYDDIFYERQLISPFFMPYLETFLNLLKTLKVSYRLRKFTPIDHFEAVFTNKKFEIREFGTSDKVLIFEKNTDLIAAEINFLEREAAWAKIIYLLPYIDSSIEERMNKRDSLLIYTDEEEIFTLLQNNNFHFAFIVGVDKQILTKVRKPQVQTSLFDF